MHVPRRSLAVVTIVLAADLLTLGGCATRVDVRSVGSADPTQAFYDMRGHSLASLQLRARELCPGGFAVLRQASHAQAADPAAGLLSKAAMSAADWLFPAGSDSAQLLVQCAATQPAGSQRS